MHAAFGVAVLATNLAAGAWGGVAWFRRVPSVGFWYLLRTAQAVVVAEVALGLVSLAQGSRPPDDLHYVYGVAPLIVALATEAMRAGAAQRELADVEDPEALEPEERTAIARRVVLREMGIMAVGALLIVTLALRALFTGGA